MIRVLSSHVDTLEVTFAGELLDERYEEFERAKKVAANLETPQLVKVAGLPFFVQPQGLKPYRFVLRNEDLHLRTTAARHIPAVHAKASALGLACYSHEALVEIARTCAWDLGADEEVGVSRIDLAVDFQGWVPTVEDMARVVCPAEYRPILPSIRNMETAYFGKGAIAVRIYNKTRELRKSGKRWVRDMWQACPGYDSDQDVWRFELQLRRERLRELGCNTCEETFERLASLLAYGMDWCSLRVPNGRSTDRWEVDARWGELRQRAQFEGRQLVEHLKREAYVGALMELVPQTAGLVVSMAAQIGVDDYETAWRIAGQAVANYLEDSDRDFRSRVQDRTARL